MNTNDDNNTTNFWISYADLMAGLLFVFILLIGAIIIKYSFLENESKLLEKVLQTKQEKLEKNQSKIDSTVIELEKTKIYLQESTDKLKYNATLLEDALVQKQKLQELLSENELTLKNQEVQLVNKEDKINEYLNIQQDYKSKLSKTQNQNLSLIEKLKVSKSTLDLKEQILNKLISQIQEKENLILAFKEKSVSLNNEIDLLTKEGKIKVIELLSKEKRIYEILKLQKDFESKLETRDNQYSNISKKLSLTQSILDEKEKKLTALLDDIIVKKNLIMSFSQTNMELNDEVKLMAEKMKKSSERHELFSKDLLSTKEKIKNLTGIKVKVITLLKQSLGKDMQIDPNNGSIRLSSNVLFEEGEHELKLESKKALEKTVYSYFNTLIENEEINKHIDKIVIEGHTNSKGSYLYNLDLSQKRAFSVMDFLFSLGFDEKDRLRNLVVASGRSFLDPIYDKNNIEDRDASRRIEIKFNLKNEDAIKEIEAILDDTR
ncbi:hypothetical protein DZA31_00330 [Arcobacter sp. HD9-500m-PIT-SAG02]|nr:hypothetical protein DZA31_00330 [Arcobacter sp. HD9-500m-PIT-SAG02]